MIEWPEGVQGYGSIKRREKHTKNPKSKLSVTKWSEINAVKGQATVTSEDQRSRLYQKIKGQGHVALGLTTNICYVGAEGLWKMKGQCYKVIGYRVTVNQEIKCQGH